MAGNFKTSISGAWGKKPWGSIDPPTSPTSLREVMQEQEQTDKNGGSDGRIRKPNGTDEQWYPGKVNRNRKRGQESPSSSAVKKEGQWDKGHQQPGMANTGHTFTAALRGESTQQEPWKQDLQMTSVISGANKYGTTVVNVHKQDLQTLGYSSLEEWIKVPGHLYIGRDMTRYVPGAVGSKWQNPFKSRYYPREDCCQKFKEYVINDKTVHENGKTLFESLEELKGKVLGCWCHPEECHGHILQMLMEQYCN